ncbi:MAG: hypothetical protein QOJ53_1094 [Sphingomonadales bacterium]|nr:hypothetical protein [Sphingomonadales bacterium]MEA3046762.1 hypothetical protein [Sphingomonadales bacterium]
MFGRLNGKLALIGALGCAVLAGCDNNPPAPSGDAAADTSNAVAPEENVEAPIDPNQQVSIEAMGE